MSETLNLVIIQSSYTGSLEVPQNEVDEAIAMSGLDENEPRYYMFLNNYTVNKGDEIPFDDCIEYQDAQVDEFMAHLQEYGAQFSSIRLIYFGLAHHMLAFRLGSVLARMSRVTFKQYGIDIDKTIYLHRSRGGYDTPNGSWQPVPFTSGVSDYEVTVKDMVLAALVQQSAIAVRTSYKTTEFPYLEDTPMLQVSVQPFSVDGPVAIPYALCLDKAVERIKNRIHYHGHELHLYFVVPTVVAFYMGYAAYRNVPPASHKVTGYDYSHIEETFKQSMNYIL